MHIDRLDLNLLRSLDALLEEKSVTRAAKRLGIGQPAVSHALSRLREALGDPLLVRTPKGMVPTPRALDLAPAVRRALEDLEQALFHPPAFDPKTSDARFRIGATDYAQFVLLPGIIKVALEQAPNVTFDVYPMLSPGEALSRGEIDLALAPIIYEEPSEGLFRQRLFEEHFISMVRKGHPLARGSRTAERFVSFPHALVTPRGTTRAGFVDEELAKIGRKRRIAVTVPHFLVAPYVIEESNLVVTIAARVARRIGKSLGLVLFEPPLRIPSFTVYQIWHAQKHNDPAHKWLRGLVPGAVPS